MPGGYTVHNIHHEAVLEEHLVQQLVEKQGYIQRRPEDYDRKLALDKELVVRFLRQTQPEEWDKLVSQYQGQAEKQLFVQLERALRIGVRWTCFATAFDSSRISVSNCARLSQHLTLTPS